MQASELQNLVEQALIVEAALTPKPGLVDSHNNGSHRDMDLALFRTSAATIASHIKYCFRTGRETSLLPEHKLLVEIRKSGLVCEQAMLIATNNVNTHKGAVFAFALVAAAIGRLVAQQQTLTVARICQQVAAICQGLVKRELAQNFAPKTAGERFYVQHGLTGARGEAESGFRTVRQFALPVYQQAMQRNLSQQHALLLVLLNLIAYNQDTNLVARGGIEGLHFTQNYARQLLTHPAVIANDLPALIELLHQFDYQLIQRNLSPGGSADLLALCYFFTSFTSR